jgi:hypothetical protein
MAIAAASDRVAFGLTIPLRGGLRRGGVMIRRLLSAPLLWLIKAGLLPPFRRRRFGVQRIGDSGSGGCGDGIHPVEAALPTACSGPLPKGNCRSARCARMRKMPCR